MKLKSFLMSLFTFILVIGAIGAQAADAGINPYVVMGALTLTTVALKMVQSPTNFIMQGVDVTIWANYIVEKLRKVNAFLEAAYDDGQFLDESGKYIILPQAGDDPKITKNRTQFPAPITTRVDADVMYPLDVYRVDPTLITNAETKEISYNKQDSVLGAHTEKLAEEIAEDTIIKWLTDLPQANIILTTGANTSQLSTGQTGSRKVFVYDNLKLAQRKMNADDVSQENRVCVITANHLDELITSFSANQYALFSQGYDASTGRIGQLFGFDFYMRSSVARMAVNASDLVVKPFQSATEQTDRDGTICFQKDAVTKALGAVDFFEDLRSAANYGDIYSAEARAGGRRRRADNKGIYVIASDAGA